MLMNHRNHNLCGSTLVHLRPFRDASSCTLGVGLLLRLPVPYRSEAFGGVHGEQRPCVVGPVVAAAAVALARPGGDGCWYSTHPLGLRHRAVSVAGPPLAGGRGDASAGQPHPRLVERLTRGGCARQRRRGGERGYPRARVDAANQRLLDHVLSAALPVRCAAE